PANVTVFMLKTTKASSRRIPAKSGSVILPGITRRSQNICSRRPRRRSSTAGRVLLSSLAVAFVEYRCHPYVIPQRRAGVGGPGRIGADLRRINLSAATGTAGGDSRLEEFDGESPCNGSNRRRDLLSDVSSASRPGALGPKNMAG